MNNIYIKIEWPDYQKYMSNKWFTKEAIMHDNCALIPYNRLHPEDIISTLDELMSVW